MSEPSVLHLYAGPSWHMEGFVVGNRVGLASLRDAINRALEGEGVHNASVTPAGAEGVCTSDGECYEVFVIRQDTSWQEKPWTELSLPYTSSDITPDKHAVWPDDLLGKDDADGRYKGKYTIEEVPGLDVDERMFGGWARMNQLFDEADALEKLARLYMGGGMSEADALERAIAEQGKVAWSGRAAEYHD